MIGYFNPEICQDYREAFDEAARRGVLTKNQAGEPYVYSAYVGDRTPPQTPVGQVDFTAPGAQEFWDGLLNQAVEDGKDGWMEDFGEYTPPDSVPRERPARQPDAQPLPGRLPLRRLGLRAARAAADRAPHPHRAGPARRAARRSSGAATRRPAGASTASIRRSRTA